MEFTQNNHNLLRDITKTICARYLRLISTPSNGCVRNNLKQLEREAIVKRYCNMQRKADSTEINHATKSLWGKSFFLSRGTSYCRTNIMAKFSTPIAGTLAPVLARRYAPNRRAKVVTSVTGVDGYLLTTIGVAADTMFVDGGFRWVEWLSWSNMRLWS